MRTRGKNSMFIKGNTHKKVEEEVSGKKEQTKTNRKIIKGIRITASSTLPVNDDDDDDD